MSFLARLGRTARPDQADHDISNHFDDFMMIDASKYSKGRILKLSEDFGRAISSFVQGSSTINHAGSLTSCPKISLGKPQIPRLLLRNVSCMRNAQQILRHVNVSSHDSGALVLTGTNGSGKSTFLRMLAGFSKPSAGEILWNGPDITKSGTFQQ
ncbi:hypothetical protein F2Q68_00030955 [Brassica cretica]|uniref:ABC transporter domain-containing protein n=1 Tax=Brassica cretica TaxID=69181 RepID=A0A8S9GC58_BRACR|nr:hypothetical protein F2Q68_00030955 [Brassica cretica]